MVSLGGHKKKKKGGTTSGVLGLVVPGSFRLTRREQPIRATKESTPMKKT